MYIQSQDQTLRFDSGHMSIDIDGSREGETMIVLGSPCNDGIFIWTTAKQFKQIIGE